MECIVGKQGEVRDGRSSDRRKKNMPFGELRVPYLYHPRISAYVSGDMVEEGSCV